MEWLKNVLNTIVAWATNTGIKIIIALVILLVSFKLINFIFKKIYNKGLKKNADKTVLKTAVYAAKLASKCIVAVCLIGYLGIDTSAITALIASLGVCVGLAVNGALSNLAGGMLILVTRPFKVDDYIDAQGVSGTVADIHIINTKIITPDNKVIYVPNGTLANGNIVNYSEKDVRRVDTVFAIAHTENVEKAKTIIQGIIDAHELILKDPESFVRVSELGDGSTSITVRAWTNTADYWTVYFDILEGVKAEFCKNGIEVPSKQLDVHIKNN